MKDPKVLHINLVAGFPARLSKDQLLHLLGCKYQNLDARLTHAVEALTLAYDIMEAKATPEEFKKFKDSFDKVLD